MKLVNDTVKEVKQKITDKQAQNTSLINIISEFGYACSEMLAFGWDVYETAYDDDPRKHMRLKSD